ncbi:MAG: hypothetical protein BGO32_12090 [Bacteroidetes bacterium 37-13]|nr:MAG: hypothetical protein BGO32_12090 [Bacteroidetes bacterium 37-13]
MSIFSKQLIEKLQIEQIKQAIQQAERNTSGEIKVHIEKHCKTEVIARAIELFHQLELQKTEQRNAVLIYVAIHDKTFAIIGDDGINQKVPANFWESTKELMLHNFKQQKIVEGIAAGIQMAGEQLKAFFPFTQGDKNELSDDISFGN